jgi:ribosomal protein L11 methylase PrmA
VLANITKNVLLAYMDILKSCLLPGGFLLLSGLLKNDSAEMLTAAANHGIKLVRNKSGRVGYRFCL